MVIKKVNALESSSSPVICLFLLSSAKHKVGNCKKPGDGEDALESGSSLSGGFSGLIDSLFCGGGGLVDLSLIHISAPTRLLSISYDVFCLNKKNKAGC